MKPVWKNSTYNVLNKLINLLLPLISSAYVSRIILPAGVGRVAAAQNVVSYFLTLAALGLPSYGVREIAKVRSDWKKLNTTFSELLIINAVSTTIAAVFYLFLILAFDRYRADLPVHIACGLQLFLNYLNIEWLYQGEEDYAYISLRSIAVKILSLGALFVLVRSREDYITYAYISSCALGLNYFLNILHAAKYVSVTKTGLQFKRHMMPLLVLLTTIFLSNLYSKVDITMLGIISTKEATGLYDNAHKIINMIVSTCAALTAVFLPRLSNYYANDREQFHSLLSKGIKLLSFLALPMTVGLFLLAPQGIEILYGKAFLAGTTVLRIFSVLIIVRCFGDLLCYQLAICTGNEIKRLPAYLIAALANILLNSVLIPRMAQNGAAIASVGSELLVNGIQLVTMKRIVNFKMEWKCLFQSLAASAVMAVSILGVLFLIESTVMKTIISVFLGSLVYLLICFVMKNEIIFLAADFIKSKLNRKT